MESDLKQWFEERGEGEVFELFQSSEKGHLCHPSSHLPQTSFPVIFYDNHLYFERLWKLESRLIEAFKTTLSSEAALRFTLPDLKNSGLLKEQQAAIHLAMQNRLTFITGGPGTGKTFTAGHLIREMLTQAPDLRVAIAAPTGRAVSQLKESLLKYVPETSFSALTLHRLLELWREEVDLLPYDLILADEASMIDLEMMVRLFESLKPGARLILMGDPDQLPPVEAGSVFADLTPFAPRAHLKCCLRAELQEIVDFAERIRCQDAQGAIRFLDHASAIRWNDTGDFNFPVAEKMTLTPLRKGKWGSEGLNQKALKENPHGPYPILITRNQDSLELYNGDQGMLTHLKPRLGDKAHFGSRKIPALLLAHFEFAWALSIHKSQGSEFPSVRLLWPEEATDFGVAALYTAVTRAKKHVEIWATRTTLTKLIETPSHRRSGIKRRLETTPENVMVF